MSAPEPAPIRPRRAIRIILILLGFGLLAWFTWLSHEELSRLIANCDIGLLTLSIILGVAFTFIQAVLFATLVHKHGNQTGKQILASAYLVSQPGKYIPGKVWSLAMQSLAMGNRVRISHITFANIELAIVSTIQTVTMGVALLYLDSPLIVILVVTAGLIACTIAAVFPLASRLKRLAPRLSSAVGLSTAPAEVDRLGIPRAIGLNAASMATNLAASWCVLLAAGSGIPNVDRLPILSSIYLGIAAGILALPIPAGLGVREAAAAGLGALLSPTVSAPMIISVSLLFRCWQIPVDIGCTVLGALLTRHEKFVDSQHPD